VTSVRIVHVNPFFHPYRGGIEWRIYHIGRRLARRHEVHVVTSQLPGTLPEERIDGLQVHRVPSHYWQVYNPPMVWSEGLERQLAALSPDVIEFHYRWARSYLRALRAFAGRVPVVFMYHNTFGEGVGLLRLPSWLNDLWVLRWVRRCDRIVCVSEHVRTQLLRHGVAPERSRTIPSGIEPSPAPATSEEPYALFLGRLVAPKGLEVLLRAARLTSLPIRIAGSGPMQARLERMVRRWELSRRVEVLGRVSEEEKRQLLDRCELFVLPSHQEAFGLVLLEAMDRGKPPVASQVGGIPEIVGEAGRLVPAGNPEALARALTELHRDPALRQRLGAAAFARAKQFDWDGLAERTEAVYAELMPR